MDLHDLFNNLDPRQEMKPYVGKDFQSVEDGVSFYEEYAHDCRFDTRRFGHKFSVGVKTWQTIVCSRQGEKVTDDEETITLQEGGENKRRRCSTRCGCTATLTLKFSTVSGSPSYVVSNFVEEHNHEMIDKKHFRYMKSNRRLGDIHFKFMQDCAKANIGPTVTFNLLKEFMGGYDSVGCTVTDIRNGARDIMQKMKGADVQMILNQMQEKKDRCDGFHYKFQQVSDGKLLSLFWCDAVSRKNYQMFGDVVSFDTTYSTNRYRMVFGPFTGKDNHGCPVTFAATFTYLGFKFFIFGKSSIMSTILGFTYPHGDVSINAVSISNRKIFLNHGPPSLSLIITVCNGNVLVKNTSTS